MIISILGLTLPVLACHGLVSRGIGERRLWLGIPIALTLAIGLSSVGWWVLLMLPIHSSTLLMGADLSLWSIAVVILWRFASDADPDSTPAASRGAVHWLAVAVVTALIVLAAVLFIALTIVMPHGTWDAWAIWNMRARFLFGGYPAGWRDAFSPLLVWSHPDYPLLLPLSIARAWTYLGADSVNVPAVWAAIFAAGIVASVAASIARARTAPRGMLAAVAILGCPAFVKHAPGQLADIPLAFYIITTFIALARAAEPHSKPSWWWLAGTSAGLAAWAKNEGVLFFVVLLACGLLLSFRGDLKGLALFLAGATPVLLALITFKLFYAPPNDVTSAWSVRYALSSISDIDRWKTVSGAFAKELWFGGAGTIGVLPILAIYLALSGIRRPVGSVLLLAIATMVVITVGYATLFVITPQHDLTWHLGTSLDRLLLQTFPTLVWCAVMAAR